MGTETERRYLVRSEEWKQMSPEAETFRQGYLSLDPERNVRVRSNGKEAFLTIKGKRKGLSRPEFEYPIPLQDAEQILNDLSVKPVLQKTRYKVRQNGQLWEIDEYGEENRGLLVAEAEIRPERNGSNGSVHLPEWLGEEISDKREFDNISLVQHPFSTWVKNGASPEPKFHLKVNESVREGVTRALQEQLRTAVHVLTRTGDPEKGIHQARKCLKKTRSLLRLVRPAVGSFYRETNSRLGELGRCLSRVRDAAALVEAVDDIAKEQKDRGMKRAAQRTAKALQRKEAEITRDFSSSGDRSEVSTGLNEVLAGASEWPLEKIDFDVILTGIGSTFKRGRKAMTQAENHPQGDNFHDWRKRAKDLRYQLSFLSKLWREVLEGYADSAKELEQTLGEDHNFSVLSELLSELDLDECDRDAMASFISKRQEKLRARALQTGELLYHGGPGHWTRLLERCWETRRQ